VVAEADHRCEHVVVVGELAQGGEHLGLAEGVEFEPVEGLDGVRYRGAHEVVERGVADGGQHLGDVGLGRTDVAGGETIVVGLRHGSSWRRSRRCRQATYSGKRKEDTVPGTFAAGHRPVGGAFVEFWNSVGAEHNLTGRFDGPCPKEPAVPT
jgi:hypothetical protein